LLERADAKAQADVFGKLLSGSPGFCDQSQFSRHFKRVVGVTPGQFRVPARIA
jgi:hypothetical protein